MKTPITLLVLLMLLTTIRCKEQNVQIIVKNELSDYAKTLIAESAKKFKTNIASLELKKIINLKVFDLDRLSL